MPCASSTQTILRPWNNAIPHHQPDDQQDVNQPAGRVGVAIPRAHKTSRITQIVQSIFCSFSRSMSARGGPKPASAVPAMSRHRRLNSRESPSREVQKLHRSLAVAACRDSRQRTVPARPDQRSLRHLALALQKAGAAVQKDFTHEQAGEDTGPLLGYPPAGPPRGARSNAGRADVPPNRNSDCASMAQTAWKRNLASPLTDRFSPFFCQSPGPDSPGGERHLDFAGRSGRRLDHHRHSPAQRDRQLLRLEFPGPAALVPGEDIRLKASDADDGRPFCGMGSEVELPIAELQVRGGCRRSERGTGARQRPFRSRPSGKLLIGVAAVSFAGAVLPYTRLGAPRIIPLPLALLGAISLLALTYLVLVQGVKTWFYRRHALL